MKTFWIFLVSSIGLFFGLPLISYLLPDLDGLGFILLLFFIINPSYCAICGFFTGKSLKQLWHLPIITVILYLIGIWVTLDFANFDFLIYCGFYIVISYILALVTALIIKQKHKQK